MRSHVLTASIEITVKGEVGVLNVGIQMTSIKLANRVSRGGGSSVYPQSMF